MLNFHGVRHLLISQQVMAQKTIRVLGQAQADNVSETNQKLRGLNRQFRKVLKRVDVHGPGIEVQISDGIGNVKAV